VYRKPDPSLPEIGARLALTRRALTLTRFQMARLIGTDVPTWGTYEAACSASQSSRRSSSPPTASRSIGFTRAGWPTCTRTSAPKFANSQIEERKGRKMASAAPQTGYGVVKHGGLADPTHDGRQYRSTGDPREKVPTAAASAAPKISGQQPAKPNPSGAPGGPSASDPNSSRPNHRWFTA
jgi:hypothetical protein